MNAVFEGDFAPSVRDRVSAEEFEVRTDLAACYRLVDLGPHRALILRNHGLLACGPTVADTWSLMYWLKTVCKVQVDVLASGAEVSMPSPGLCETLARRYGPDGPLDLAPLEWPAMLRQLDRDDMSYRT